MTKIMKERLAYIAILILVFVLAYGFTCSSDTDYLPYEVDRGMVTESACIMSDNILHIPYTCSVAILFEVSGKQRIYIGMAVLPGDVLVKICQRYLIGDMDCHYARYVNPNKE